MVGERAGDGATGEGPSGLVWSPWSGTYNFDSCTNATYAQNITANHAMCIPGLMSSVCADTVWCGQGGV